ncbi:MAG: hypothetical protein SGJ00_12275 [bacterium]|nr:hypothetical protein [bacterium]
MEKKTLINQENLLLLAIVALLNFLLWIGFSGYGIGLSVDSANYFSVAQSLSEGKGFLQFDNFAYLNAPPLYPILLSTAYFLGLNPLSFALVLQFAFFNLSLFFYVKILRLWFSGWHLLLVFGFGAGSYFNFAHVYLFALSEAGAVTFLLAYLFFLVRAKPKDLWFGAVFFSLLVLQRYVGWFLLPGIALFWFLEKRRAWDLVWHLLPAMMLAGLWFCRNALLGTNALGEHQVASKLNLLAFGENTKAILQGILSGNKLFAAILMFLVCMAFGFWNLKILHGKMRKVNLLVLLMGLGFLLLLLLEEHLSMAQLPRYLSILWMPLMLLPALFLLHWTRMGTQGKWVLVAMILVQTVGVWKQQYHCRIAGAGGFNAPKWQAYKGMGHLQRLQEGDLVSNFPDMVWWLTGKKCQYSPFLGEAKRDYEKRGVLKGKVLIWFKDSSRDAVMEADFGKLQSNFRSIENLDGVEIGYIE